MQVAHRQAFVISALQPLRARVKQDGENAESCGIRIHGIVRGIRRVSRRGIVRGATAVRATAVTSVTCVAKVGAQVALVRHAGDGPAAA